MQHKSGRQIRQVEFGGESVAVVAEPADDEPTAEYTRDEIAMIESERVPTLPPCASSQA